LERTSPAVGDQDDVIGTESSNAAALIDSLGRVDVPAKHPVTLASSRCGTRNRSRGPRHIDELVDPDASVR
jgi:hypothetical protein